MYRDATAPGPRCATHPAAPSHATCSRCTAHVCLPCTLSTGVAIVCPRCLNDHMTTRRTRRRFAITVAAIALCLGGFALQKRVRDPYGWGNETKIVLTQQKVLTDSPCDERALDKMVAALLRAGDRTRAFSILDPRLEACSFSERMHENAFALHMWNDDAGAAVADASRLIRLRPLDPMPRAMRATAARRAGRPELADEDERLAAQLKAAL